MNIHKLNQSHKLHRSILIRQVLRMTALALLAVILIGTVFMSFTAKANAGEEKKVRVGWFESTYCHLDQLGRRSGLAYDYQQKIAAYNGWTYEYVDGTWPELLQMLRNGEIDMHALVRMVSAAGREHLILDLSARKRDDSYLIVTDRWQKFTSVELNLDTLADLASYCDEFLIHAVDVEGRNSGIESEVVGMLGGWNGIPVTYAGGIHSFDDLYLIDTLGSGRVNVTIGSALDLFGGTMPFKEVIEYCRK